MRGRSYTPSPPRGYGRRGRSPPPRGGGRYGREAPTSLLVRNLRHDCRPDDLKRPFSHFGPVKDIYLPRDYYTGNPRGFGFVQFVDPADAADAKHEMDGQVFQGRELTVVFAEENRKKPTEMRMRERGGRDHVYDRRRSPRRYSRSRSPLPRHSRDYYSPPKRRYSGSVSPRDRRYSRERSFSRSPPRGHSPDAPKARSGTPVIERSPYGSRSRTPQSPVRSASRGRSRSPYPEEDDYSREKHRARRDDGSPY